MQIFSYFASPPWNHFSYPKKKAFTLIIRYFYLQTVTSASANRHQYVRYCKVTSNIDWTYTDDVFITEHFRLDTVEVDYNFGMTLKITSDLSFYDMRLAQRRRYYKKPQPSDIHPEYVWDTNVAPNSLKSTDPFLGVRTYTIHWNDPDGLLFFANDTELPASGMHKSDTWSFTFTDSNLIEYTIKVNQNFYQKSVGYVTVINYNTYITTNFRN